MSADKFEGIEADFECSWWPDDWFNWLANLVEGWDGVSLTEACIKHDVGGSDFQLAKDVFLEFWRAAIQLTLIDPWLGSIAILVVATGTIIAPLMFLGVTFGRPIYMAIKRRD